MNNMISDNMSDTHWYFKLYLNWTKKLAILDINVFRLKVVWTSISQLIWSKQINCTDVNWNGNAQFVCVWRISNKPALHLFPSPSLFVSGNHIILRREVADASAIRNLLSNFNLRESYQILEMFFSLIQYYYTGMAFKTQSSCILTWGIVLSDLHIVSNTSWSGLQA